jgi:hypothetical protein
MFAAAKKRAKAVMIAALRASGQLESCDIIFERDLQPNLRRLLEQHGPGNFCARPQDIIDISIQNMEQDPRFIRLKNTLLGDNYGPMVERAKSLFWLLRREPEFIDGCGKGDNEAIIAKFSERLNDIKPYFSYCNEGGLGQKVDERNMTSFRSGQNANVTPYWVAATQQLAQPQYANNVERPEFTYATIAERTLNRTRRFRARALVAERRQREEATRRERNRIRREENARAAANRAREEENARAAANRAAANRASANRASANRAREEENARAAANRASANRAREEENARAAANRAAANRAREEENARVAANRAREEENARVAANRARAEAPAANRARAENVGSPAVENNDDYNNSGFFTPRSVTNNDNNNIDSNNNINEIKNFKRLPSRRKNTRRNN